MKPSDTEIVSFRVSTELKEKIQARLNPGQSIGQFCKYLVELAISKEDFQDDQPILYKVIKQNIQAFKEEIESDLDYRIQAIVDEKMRLLKAELIEINEVKKPVAKRPSTRRKQPIDNVQNAQEKI